MRFLLILVVIAAAGQFVAVGSTYAGVSPIRTEKAPGLTVVHVQSAGSTKIRKECQDKGKKQGLKGLSLDAYVEKYMKALEFNTKYGGTQ